MKHALSVFRPRLLQALIVGIIALLAIGPIVEARSAQGSRGGEGRSSGASRSASKPSRSPMTGSRTTQRPASRPQSRPSTREASRTSSRPAARPSTRPSTQPATRPAGRPETRPSTRPAERPAGRPETRPSTRPAERPAGRPETRPSTRPAERPSRPETRPETKPGNVSYPRPENRPSRPGDRPSTRPADRPGDRPNVRPGDRPGDRPGVRPDNRPDRPINRPDFENRPGRPGDRPGIADGPGNRPGSGQGDWWDRRPNRDRDRDINNIGNRVNIGNDINVNIDNDFRRNWNYSTNRRHWGSSPWWGHPQHNNWHHGHWHGNWGHNHRPYWRQYHHHHYHHFPGYWDDDNWGVAVAWGLAGWGLGNIIYNTGYRVYSNPYRTQNVAIYEAPAPASAPTPPPVYNIDYSQPLAMAAQPAVEVMDAQPEEKQELAETKALESLDAARTAFKDRDYITALGKTQEALAYDPGDPVIHEFRALCLFALGKYADAAIVLNSVLASGPGWGWETMIGIYDAQSTYTEHLKTLEDYAYSNEKSGDAQFLLGYHYMTAGFMAEASIAFGAASKLHPADSVSQQLHQLASSSATGEESATGDVAEEAEPEEMELIPPPALEDLRGAWVADRGEEGTITLAITPEDKFTWTFTRGEKSNELSGEASINEGLLVLTAAEAQMVGAAAVGEGKEKMSFILAGGPPGDPGLAFVKKD